MFTLMDQRIFTACVNAIVTVVLTTCIYAAFWYELAR